MMFFLPGSYELTKTQKKILREQQIDEQGPGTILPDFQSLLDFVGERNVPVTGTHLLPLKLLKPLNEQLSHPIQLGLTRPQQKSYPNLNGLYLLLRTTGLGQIDTRPKKPKLVIDPDVLQSWSGLNPTEQYLTLLETWLMRSRGEVIGERRGPFWSDMPISNWADFFEKIPADGVQIAGNSEIENRLRYWPGLHNLALLELFGLITVKDGPIVKGEGWQIEQVWRTPLGDALLALLAGYFKNELGEVLFEYDDPSEIPFGILQPVLQPYFPDWRNNLTFPTAEFQEGIHIFRVSLWDKIWRRIAIPASSTLEELAAAIINAFDFDFDHLYRFTYPNRFGTAKEITHPYMDESPATTEVQIGDLPLQPGASMEFVYDFGDWWEFGVTLEQIGPPDPTVKKPVLLEKHGEAPPQYPIWEDEEDWEE